MSFDEYWETIEKRNNWSPETVVEVKVSGLKKLAEQAWQKSAENSARLNDFMDRVTGGGYGFDVRKG